MSHLALPYELIILIAEQLGRKDLNSFLEVNRCFSQLLTPLLNRFALRPKHRKNAIFWAAAMGNKELVRLLVEKGRNILVKGSGDDSTYFRPPERYRVTDIVNWILEKGSRVIIQDVFDLCTPVHDAARYRRRFILASLLEMGADVSVRDIRGYTALHHAVWQCDKVAVRMLLNHGANANSLDNDSLAPLHIAAASGNTEIAGLLLKSGANVNLQAKNGSTPVELSDIWDHEMASLLLRNSSPHFRTSLKQTALHLAACYGDSSVIDTLLEKGIDVNSTDIHGNTPLQEATAAGYTSMVVHLLDRGADVNVANSDGMTPLLTSLVHTPWEHSVNIITALLDRNANVNRRDSHENSVLDFLIGIAADHAGQSFIERILQKVDIKYQNHYNLSTALHLAATIGSKETVQVLLERGADVTHYDRHGWTPLHLAAVKPTDDAKIRLLLAYGADPAAKTRDHGKTAIDLAFEFGNMRASLLWGASTTFRTMKGNQSPLHLAVQLGHLELVRFFLIKGIDVNLQDSRGCTALHYAAHALEREIVKLLLDEGADNTIQDAQGMTPVVELLHLIEAGSLSGEIVGLLAKGFRLDERDKEGLTLIDHAALNGHVEGMDVLGEMGADAEARDGSGWSAEDLATLWRMEKAESREECVEMGKGYRSAEF